LDAQVETHESWILARELFDEAAELSGYARRQRSRGRSRERFQNARDAQREASELRKRARQLERQAVRGVLETAQVVCATCTALGGGELAEATYDLCLLDEATQAIEPLALFAFLRSTRVVLAGDHCQLPPTVISERAAKEGLAVSLFERLLADHGEGAKLMLREQYRMHEQLMRFPSRTMYAGELRAHPSVAQRSLAELCTGEVEASPLVFVDTAGKGFDEESDAGQESLYNSGEAELIVARVRALLAAGLSPRDVGVISPYRAQAALLRRLLSSEPGATDLEVDTIDAFQGREKEVVLVSLTRANPRAEIGFLGELRRINVAITRPKRQLWLVGDSGTLGQHPYYAALIEEAQTQGGYRSAWELADS
jgi:predicted DNA helicase